MAQFMESSKLSTQSLCSVWGLFTNKGFSVSKEPPTKKVLVIERTHLRYSGRLD